VESIFFSTKDVKAEEKVFGKKRSSGKGRRERVMRGKYGQSTLCTHMKMS
jgi:hypothetical protein